jgi:hypothetical protein
MAVAYWRCSATIAIRLVGNLEEQARNASNLQTTALPGITGKVVYVWALIPVALVRAVLFVSALFALIALTSAKPFKFFLQGDIGWRAAIGTGSHGANIYAAAEMGLFGDAFAAPPVDILAISVVRACRIRDTCSAVSAPGSIVAVARSALGYKSLLAGIRTIPQAADFTVRETRVVTLAPVRHRPERCEVAGAKGSTAPRLLAGSDKLACIRILGPVCNPLTAAAGHRASRPTVATVAASS